MKLFGGGEKTKTLKSPTDLADYSELIFNFSGGAHAAKKARVPSCCKTTLTFYVVGVGELLSLKLPNEVDGPISVLNSFHSKKTKPNSQFSKKF